MNEKIPVELTSDATCPDCGGKMQLANPSDPECESFWCGECGFNESVDTNAPASGEWLIQLRGEYLATRGIWERPGHRGYTNEIAEAGRYSEADAKKSERMQPEKYKAVQLPAPLNGQLEPVNWDHPSVDPIVTELYRKFKEWSQRGFTADDVTWCEVRGYVSELLNIATTTWTPCAEKMPKIGQRVILKSQGVVQHFMPTLDEGDEGPFWDFEINDFDPPVDFERDQWMPVPSVQGGDQ